MSRSLRDKIEYAMLCINKFAKAKELTPQQACSYLYDFKGLQFLDTAYPVESALSSRIVVEDLHSVCQRNGGTLPRQCFIMAPMSVLKCLMSMPDEKAWISARGSI